LRLQEQELAATQRVIESLAKTRDSLKLGNLSSLSPIGKLEEARRQFEVLLTAAKGGNKDAAGNVAGAAQALLEASRDVNASGLGYVADFNRVQAVLAGLQDQYGAQLTTEQQILATLQNQVTYLEQQIDAIQAAKDAAAADAQRQIDELKKIPPSVESLYTFFTNPVNGNSIGVPPWETVTYNADGSATITDNSGFGEVATNSKSTVDELRIANEKLTSQIIVTSEGLRLAGQKLDNVVAVIQGLTAIVSQNAEASSL
jgi:hypothetical protein